MDQVFADSGLRPGDEVIAVDDVSIADWLHGVGPAADRRLGDVLTYRVSRPDTEQQIDIQVRLVHYPFWAALRADGILLVLVALLFAVAAGVFLARPEDQATPALLVAGLSLPWVIAEFPLGLQVVDLVGAGGRIAWTVADVAACVMWAGLLHFSLVFPEPWSALRRRPWLAAPGCYLLPFLLHAVSLIWILPSNGGVIYRFIALWSVSGQAAVAVPVLVAARFLAVLVFTRDPDVRRRVRWIAGSCVGGGVLYLILGQLPIVVVGHGLIPEQWLILVFLPIPLALAAAILRYRLFDIEIILRRSLIVGALTVAVGALYAVVLLVLRADVPTGTTATGIALVAGGMVALLAFSVRQRLARRVTALFYGHRDDPAALIQRLSRLDTAAEADLLLPAIARTLAQSLRLPYVRLELHGADGSIAVGAEFGSMTRPPMQLPITSHSEVLGRLDLDAGPGREPFGPADQRLLREISRYLAEACRTVLLASALQRSRENLVLAREEERRRLRRDLHDGVGPTLAALSLQLEVTALIVRSNPDAAIDKLGLLSAATQSLISDVRRLVDDLRPPSLDQLGLVRAIAEYIRTFDSFGPERSGGFSVEMRVADDLGVLPAAVEVAAFRIAVEAVTNAARHSGGHHCTVDLRSDGDLLLDIDDDGSGLTPRSAGVGVGLDSMRQRAAELGGVCIIGPGKDSRGTAVRVRLPVRSRGRVDD